MARISTKPQELRELKVDELRGQLKKRGVSGISSLNKEELVKKLVRTLGKEDKSRSTGKATSGGSSAGRKPTSSSKASTSRTSTSKAGTSRASTSKSSSSGRSGGSASKPKYSQEITSTADRPDRPGRSLTTTDHDVIQQWAQERNAVPATVAGTEHDGRVGVLRLDFPGYAQAGDTSRLRQVSWDQWFRTFDERGLNFIYQQERAGGGQSNFFRLENPQREDA